MEHCRHRRQHVHRHAARSGRGGLHLWVATGKVKETLKILVELLAAIPSIIWGFIGLVIVSPIIQDVFNVEIGVNLLNASLMVSMMAIPLIVSISEDSLRAVPDSYREAALALGASRWEVIYKVLFPAAKNGLLAASMLGVGRAVGETMAVWMASGGTEYPGRIQPHDSL